MLLKAPIQLCLPERSNRGSGRNIPSLGLWYLNYREWVDFSFSSGPANEPLALIGNTENT
jgi:hypothetical protein